MVPTQPKSVLQLNCFLCQFLVGNVKKNCDKREHYVVAENDRCENRLVRTVTSITFAGLQDRPQWSEFGSKVVLAPHYGLPAVTGTSACSSCLASGHVEGQR